MRVHRALWRVGACALLALGLHLGAARWVWADIISLGDTTVAQYSTSNTTVGNTGTGSLTLQNGGQLSDNYGYVGNGNDAFGTVTVNGSSSKWTNTSTLYVGNSGSGLLNVQAGGQVSCGNGYLGGGTGGAGAATVTGSGSAWTCSASLFVGSPGNGSLTVSNGGQVTAQTLCASLSDLKGDGTITATGGAVLDASLTFDAAHGTTNTLSFGTGGTLNVTATSSGNLGAGFRGTGSLSISGGMVANSNAGYVGYNAGSNGTVTVSGSGSKWSNGSAMFVGDFGSGTLNVLGGAQVTSSIGSGAVATVGYAAGSSGALTVSGTGSRFTNAGSLVVGRYGAGVLEIDSGGQVSDTSATVGTLAGGSGAVTVTGAGSTWSNSSSLAVGGSARATLTVASGGRVTATTLLGSPGDFKGDGTIVISKGICLDADLVFDATHGTTQSMPFGSGGTLTWTLAGGGLGAGYNTAGTLGISGGVTVTSAGGTLGYNAGSSGTATVSGAGTTWSTGSGGLLQVGYYGSGTLNVQGGAHVSAGDAYLGGSRGATGAATVTGTGSTWSLSSGLHVGSSGSGSVSILNGAQVISGSTSVIGDALGSSGTVTVDGAGSNWAGTGGLNIGTYGSGTLTVSNGAQVSTWVLEASAADLRGNGTITASIGGILDANLVFDAAHGTTNTLAFGSGGTLKFTTNGNELGVGFKGTGSMTVSGGLSIPTTSVVLGDLAGSSGAATVSGAGSALTYTNYTYVYVGYAGSGTLNVRSGGLVNCTSGYVGAGAGAAGAATVSGAGSTWANSSNFYVGFSGSGTLNVVSGGQVSNTVGYVGDNAGAAGSVAVTGAGSAWNNSLELYVGNLGSGSVVVADGGKVTATKLFVTAQSAVRLQVSNDGMIVLGNAFYLGTVNNSGAVAYYADSSLPAGTYHPITEYAGRAMSWSGSGTFTAVGGVLDASGQTFTVSAPTLLTSGATDVLSTGERLLFSDAGSGKHLGASFGTITGGGTTFSATPATVGEVAALVGLLGSGQQVAAAWDCTTNFSGAEALLSMDVGTGYQGLSVWHLSGGLWTPYVPNLLTYEGSGVATFTVSSFSGYAITALLPEPAAVASVVLLGAGLLTARRRRRECVGHPAVPQWR